MERTCRVNANVATDVKEETPMEIALDREDTDMVVLLSKATGQEIPDDAKIRQLSSLMYQEDQEKAKKEFGELLETLPSKLVSSVHRRSDLFCERWLKRRSTVMEVFSKTLFSRGKLTSFASFCNMGGHLFPLKVTNFCHCGFFDLCTNMNMLL